MKTNKERCFADRKDGTCHALYEKKCEGCKFYFPRKLIKYNPIYAYSYDSAYQHRKDAIEHKVSKAQIMGEND